jgi:hypothetical protein
LGKRAILHVHRSKEPKMMVHPTLTNQIADTYAASLRASASPVERRFSRQRAARPGGAGNGRLALLRRQLLALGLPENDLT